MQSVLAEQYVTAYLFIQKALTAFQSIPGGNSMVVTVGNLIA